MKGYKLVETNERYKLIMHKGDPIGRVARHADGTYIGLIGKFIIVRGCPSERVAMLEAVAQHLRYDHAPTPKRKAPTQPRREPAPAIVGAMPRYAQMRRFSLAI